MPISPELATAYRWHKGEALARFTDRRFTDRRFTDRRTLTAVREQVRLALATIAAARETMREAVEGDGPHGLCVYMGPREKAAFCEAAGLEACSARALRG